MVIHTYLEPSVCWLLRPQDNWRMTFVFLLEFQILAKFLHPPLSGVWQIKRIQQPCLFPLIIRVDFLYIRPSETTSFYAFCWRYVSYAMCWAMMGPVTLTFLGSPAWSVQNWPSALYPHTWILLSFPRWTTLLQLRNLSPTVTAHQFIITASKRVEPSVSRAAERGHSTRTRAEFENKLNENKVQFVRIRNKT